MKTVKDTFEENFDPTDADNAMQLGYQTLGLLRLCQRILDDEYVRLGRDQKIELAVKMRDAGERLGVLNRGHSGKESDVFHASLRDLR